MPPQAAASRAGWASRIAGVAIEAIYPPHRTTFLAPLGWRADEPFGSDPAAVDRHRLRRRRPPGADLGPARRRPRARRGGARGGALQPPPRPAHLPRGPAPDGVRRGPRVAA